MSNIFCNIILISQLKFLYPLKTLVFPAFSSPWFGPFPSFFPLREEMRETFFRPSLQPYPVALRKFAWPLWWRGRKCSSWYLHQNVPAAPAHPWGLPREREGWSYMLPELVLPLHKVLAVADDLFRAQPSVRGQWHKAEMQVGRFLVHVDNSRDKCPSIHRLTRAAIFSCPASHRGGSGGAWHTSRQFSLPLHSLVVPCVLPLIFPSRASVRP